MGATSTYLYMLFPLIGMYIGASPAYPSGLFPFMGMFILTERAYLLPLFFSRVCQFRQNKHTSTFLFLYGYVKYG